MKQGILKKITISQTIVQEIIDVLQATIKEDTYENQFNHSKQIPTQIKKKFFTFPIVTRGSSSNTILGADFSIIPMINKR